MDVNVSGSVSSTNTYSDYSSSKTAEKKSSESKEDKAAVYEKSEVKSSATYSISKMSESDRAALVQKLKQDQEDRQNQLTSLVQKMFNNQGATYDSIWKMLSSGKFTVDAQTKAQAQADISEDGYYGVKQTSERMFDFAMALAGDDVDKMKEMQAAVKKGYEQAEKTWGGKLPSICSETLDEVNKLFDDYYKSKSTTTE